MNFKYRHKEPNQTSGDNQKSPLLLLLHGRGADENDLFGLAPYLDERFFIVSPRAPIVMPYGGYEWFELIIGNGGEISVNVQHFLKSRELISEFIGELVAEHDLDAERIYLCGFSQGAIMSLSAALSEPEKFAGVVAMSGRAMPEMLPPKKIRTRSKISRCSSLTAFTIPFCPSNTVALQKKSCRVCPSNWNTKNTQWDTKFLRKACAMSPIGYV